MARAYHKRNIAYVAILAFHLGSGLILTKDQILPMGIAYLICAILGFVLLRFNARFTFYMGSLTTGLLVGPLGYLGHWLAAGVVALSACVLMWGAITYPEPRKRRTVYPKV